MKSVLLISCLVAAAVASGQNVDFSRSINGKDFVSFDFPQVGVTDTEATAITPSGVVAGRYFTSDGTEHGFVLHNGAFTPIDVSGSMCGTDAAWINSRRDIVGSYCSNNKLHGYVLRAGAVTTIDFSLDPNVNTTGFSISNSGDVVGVGFIGSDFFHGQGYIFSHGQITTINFPGALGTFPTMILDPQRIVGTYLGTDSVVHGFFLNEGRATTIDVPNSVFTWITGINPDGAMVGFYFDSSGNQHGFVLSQGTFTTVDIPGGTFSEVNGIDPQGNVVGRYVSNGITHAYYLPKPY